MLELGGGLEPRGVLELGRAGSAGAAKGVAPVLRGGAVVATLHASNWKEAATAVVDGRTWLFGRQGRELTGRRAEDPEGTVRLRARQTSVWKGTWALELEGTAVEVGAASRWRGTHRFVVDGRPVAESGTAGGWTQRPTLRAGAAVPLAHQVFLLWFEAVLRRRTAAITVGVAAGGAAAAG